MNDLRHDTHHFPTNLYPYALSTFNNSFQSLFCHQGNVSWLPVSLVPTDRNQSKVRSLKRKQATDWNKREIPTILVPVLNKYCLNTFWLLAFFNLGRNQTSLQIKWKQFEATAHKEKLYQIDDKRNKKTLTLSRMLLAPLVATNVPVMEYTKTPIPEFMHGPVICSAIIYIKWKVCSVGCSLPSVIISSAFPLPNSYR